MRASSPEIFTSSFRSVTSLNPLLAWSSESGAKGWFVLRFPLGLGWYKAQPCTRFRFLRHRKERTGVRHEFIVLHLADGSICRMERMGDPDARINALTADGTTAYDVVQCFASDRISDAHLNTSDVVAHITFPRELDILDVLRVCRAIHEGEKTRNYTLQTFNCYFFTLAIQSTLTRCIADWNEKITIEAWRSNVDGALSALSRVYEGAAATRSRQRQRQPFFLRLYLLLGLEVRWLGLLVDRLRNRLSNEDMAMQIKSLTASALWSSDVEFAVRHSLEKAARDTMEDTLCDRAPTPSGDITSLHQAGDLPLGSATGQCGVLLGALVLRTASMHKQLDRQSSALFGRLQEYARRFRDFALSLPRVGPEFVGTLDFRPSSSPRVSTSRQLGAKSVTKRLTSFLAQRCIIIGSWAIGFALLLCGILPTHLAQRVTVEDELTPTLVLLEDLAEGSTIDVTPMTQKLDFLVTNKGVVVWDEWPWAHTYTPIKDKLCDTVYKGEQALLAVRLQDNKPASIQAMSVSSFQNHLLNRIKLHANLVGSFGLASADRVYSEIVDKLSQVWVLARNDEDPDFESPTWSGAAPPPPPHVPTLTSLEGIQPLAPVEIPQLLVPVANNDPAQQRSQRSLYGFEDIQFAD